MLDSGRTKLNRLYLIHFQFIELPPLVHLHSNANPPIPPPQALGSGSMYHPRGSWLGMSAGERIVNVSAAGIRVSLLTDAGRIATYLDESIGKLCVTF